MKEHRCGVGDLGLDSRAAQLDTVWPVACRRCNVSSELCCPPAEMGTATSYAFRCDTENIMKIWFWFDHEVD